MEQRVLLFLALFFFICLSRQQLNAQVTVGSNIPPEKAALLDLKTQTGDAGTNTSTRGGLLLPRVALNNLNELNIFETINPTDPDYTQQKLKHTGLTVYNTEVNVAQSIEKGIYVWDGEKWDKANSSKEINFFYMPSIVIDTRTPGTFTVNLHQKYLEQFQFPAVRSTGAPVSIPFYMQPEDLYYYVTDYDQNVFNNVTVNEFGIMTYDVVQPAVDGTSFMNIVFVIK